MIPTRPAEAKGRARRRRLELTARYEIEVSDGKRLSRFAEQRLLQAQESLDGDPYDHPVEALSRLYELDGWRLETCDEAGIDVTDSEWRCGPSDR